MTQLYCCGSCASTPQASVLRSHKLNYVKFEEAKPSIISDSVTGPSIAVTVVFSLTQQLIQQTSASRYCERGLFIEMTASDENSRE